MSNIETVKEIYAAFGRGDVPAILDRLADDVRWDHWPDGSGAQRHGVAWLAERTGREEVAGFFAALSAFDIHEFAPRALLEGDGMVAAINDFDATVIATGTRIRDVDVHLWSFGADGRVTEFRTWSTRPSTSRPRRRGRSSEVRAGRATARTPGAPGSARRPAPRARAPATPAGR